MNHTAHQNTVHPARIVQHIAIQCSTVHRSTVTPSVKPTLVRAPGHAAHIHAPCSTMQYSTTQYRTGSYRTTVQGSTETTLQHTLPQGSAQNAAVRWRHVYVKGCREMSGKRRIRGIRNRTLYASPITRSPRKPQRSYARMSDSLKASSTGTSTPRCGEKKLDKRNWRRRQGLQHESRKVRCMEGVWSLHARPCCGVSATTL